MAGRGVGNLRKDVFDISCRDGIDIGDGRGRVQAGCAGSLCADRRGEDTFFLIRRGRGALYGRVSDDATPFLVEEKERLIRLFVDLRDVYRSANVPAKIVIAERRHPGYA